MRRISIFLFTIAVAVWQSGCGGAPENANVNKLTPAASPTTAANNNSNSANDNSNVNTAAKVEEKVPTFSDAATALTEGNKYFDANKTENAIEAFQQAVKLNPDLAEAHFKLGVAYAMIEKEKEEKVELSPNDPNQPTPTKTPKKGKEVELTKDSEKAFAEAVKAYKKIVAKNPKDDAAHFNLGRSYNKLNDDKEAERALRQAVRLKPDDTEYQTELGAILIKFAKYDEAIGVLKKALKLDESNSQAQDLMDKATAGKKRTDYGIPKDKPKSDK